MGKPFGDDANDLPLVDEQNVLDDSLVLLLHPCVQTLPDFTLTLDSKAELQTCAAREDFGAGVVKLTKANTKRQGATIVRPWLSSRGSRNSLLKDDRRQSYFAGHS